MELTKIAIIIVVTAIFGLSGASQSPQNLRPDQVPSQIDELQKQIDKLKSDLGQSQQQASPPQLARPVVGHEQMYPGQANVPPVSRALHYGPANKRMVGFQPMKRGAQPFVGWQPTKRFSRPGRMIGFQPMKRSNEQSIGFQPMKRGYPDNRLYFDDAATGWQPIRRDAGYYGLRNQGGYPPVGALPEPYYVDDGQQDREQAALDSVEEQLRSDLSNIQRRFGISPQAILRDLQLKHQRRLQRYQAM